MIFHVVRRNAGNEWDPDLPFHKQASWPDHARFMNELEATGFVILGGPVDHVRVVYAIEAGSEEEVRATFARDPWADTLCIVDSIEPWDTLLDSRPARSSQD